MSSKVIFVFCAQALLIQSVLSQCTSRAAVEASGIAAPYGWAGPAIAYEGLAAPFGVGAPLGLAAPGLGLAGRGLAYDGLYAPALDITPTTGGGLTVTSASAIPPTGISIISENAFEGILSVAGEVPFVGTTGMEGILPSAGAGAINHACGNGVNAMLSEGAAFAPGYAGAYAPGLAGIAPAAAFGAVAPGAAIAPTAFAPGLVPAAYPGRGSGIYL